MRKILIAVLAVILLMTVSTSGMLANGGSVHYVQWGESLSSIAYAYGVTIDAVMAANNLDDADFVYVGQKLIIPTEHMGSAGKGQMGDGYYTVQAGDTLNSIAAQFNTSAEALAIANNLDDADFVYVGQVLSVPGMTKSAPTMKPPGSTSSGYQSCANYYTVDWGDTLSSIAWAHGTTVNELLQANSLYSEIIYEGQRLCLPGMSGQDRPQAPMGSMSMSMNAPMPSMSSDYYIVKKGDTVSAIAYRFGVSVAALIRVNNLSNTGLIYEGQKLVIAATADNPGQGSMMPNPNRPSDNHKPGSQQPGQQQSYVEIWMDNADYQDWGRPVDGLTSCTGNTGPFDDSHPIRRLTVSVYVTYHADENEKPLPSTWVNDVVFNTVGGDERIACYWPTDTRLKPGETVNVTFYTHLENDDARVKDMRFAFDAAPGTICLQPGSGMVGQCNSNERSKW